MLSRDAVATIQLVLDAVGALGCVYILAVVTQNFGFGSLRAQLQLAHRVAMMCVSASFAYHAYDIAMRPAAHGLTLPNIFLHACLIASIIISALRIRRSQKEIESRGGPTANYTNGDIIAGPFHH